MTIHDELAAIQGRHQREVIAVHESHGEEAWCPQCEEHWPCSPTIMARALQAVVDLHARVKFDPMRDLVTHGQAEFPDVCVTCSRTWPCDEFRAIEEAMEVGA
ncbi:hypothetical protein [Demequina globuliformis]|uniref:hypothetical protein n=1 Tax=Demequina globuliformis TaxID=676202 RepID=UPI0007819E01|nr:hypothetical protein [Demequina globuliformis]